MIFTLHQIQEKYREQNLPLYICFDDFRKAFDIVPRDMLWRILGRYGCPEKSINIKLFHEGMKAQVIGLTMRLWPHYQCLNDRSDVPTSPYRAEYHDPAINFNGSPLPNTKSFTYLGSTVTHDASLDNEISNRIQAAYSSFARLTNRLWHRHGVKLSTKIAVYRAIILPILLYSSETYILYQRHIKRLSKVLQRQLRSIMGIRLQDRISNMSNEEVLQRAGMMSLESIIMKSQLRWTGHVLRMNSKRLPRQTLYGALKTQKPSLLPLHDALKRQHNASQDPS